MTTVWTIRHLLCRTCARQRPRHTEWRHRRAAACMRCSIPWSYRAEQSSPGCTRQSTSATSKQERARHTACWRWLQGARAVRAHQRRDRRVQPPVSTVHSILQLSFKEPGIWVQKAFCAEYHGYSVACDDIGTRHPCAHAVPTTHRSTWLRFSFSKSIFVSTLTGGSSSCSMADRAACSTILA